MNYVVTTSIGRRDEEKVFRKEVWHSGTPLKVGHPLMWLIETTPKGVRITDLRGKGGQVFENHVREITHDELNENTEFQLHEGKHAVRVKIEPAAVTHPVSRNFGDILKVYRSMNTSTHSNGGYGLRKWVMDSVTMDSSNPTQTALLSGEKVFNAKWENSKLTITSWNNDLMVGDGRVENALEFKKALVFEQGEIANLQLQYGNSIWHFGFASSEAMNNVASTLKLPVVDLGTDQELSWFKKSLQGAALALLAFLMISWMWPKPQEELVPAQFAKIILTSPKKVPVGAAESAPAAKAVAQKKVQETAVVQAFRAKALQNAVSGLMKGGMTKLLAQSDLITGHQLHNESRKIFDTQATNTKATAPEIGDLNSKNVAVASVGGDGLPGSTGSGKAVGYGKGEHAGVKGQGKGFVSMDMGNASVEEGLTKDEVGEVIHRHLSEVRYCYESAMIRQPDIEGKLVVDFTIGGNGVVKTAEAKSSTLPDPRLDDCIIRRLVTWKFPNTKGGIDVSVSYPFIFKTLGR
jgi:outer membrane biosynthesis protein TonB